MTAASTLTRPAALLPRVLDRAAGWLRDLDAARRATAEVEQLLSAPEAELARRGLRRRDIVAHSFRRHFAG